MKLKNLKFARKKNNNFTYVLEYEPQIRSIIMAGGGSFFAGQKEPKPLKVYRLAFPYLTLILNFKGREYDKAVVGLRNTPLTSVKDTLCRLPMSNIYRQPLGMGVCMTVPKEDCRPEWSIKQKIESVVGLFWQTRFVSVTPHIAQKVDKRVSNYNAWKACTKRNPNFVTTVGWNNPNHTVLELMDLMPGSAHAGVGSGGYERHSGNSLPRRNPLKAFGDFLDDPYHNHNNLLDSKFVQMDNSRFVNPETLPKPDKESDTYKNWMKQMGCDEEEE